MVLKTNFGGPHAKTNTCPVQAARNSLLIVVVLLTVAGCFQENHGDNRAYSGDLNARQLVGRWVISEQSLKELPRLGFSQFTNKWDHEILLNEDGTCVSRTFFRFRFKLWWQGESEQQQHDQFVWDSRPNGTPSEARSWYLRYSNRWPLLAGPYSQTNDLSAKDGILCKNRWSRWNVMDSSLRGKWFEDQSLRLKTHFLEIVRRFG